MKSKFIKLTIMTTVLILLCLSTSCHEHIFSEATCTEDAVCECGEISEPALGHEYTDADCENPKICSVCNETEGSALGHNYIKGICTACNKEDPDYFNPKKYGFTNNYGMTKWVEIKAYNIKTEDSYVKIDSHDIAYNFDNNTLYGYRSYLSNRNYVDWTANYNIANNNSVTNNDGFTYTILERVSNSRGNLIIKAKVSGKDRWFVLEDQIDWNRSPEETDDGKYKCYFK